MAKRRRGETKQTTLAQAFKKGETTATANANELQLSADCGVVEEAKNCGDILKKFEEYLSKDALVPDVEDGAAGLRRSGRERTASTKYSESVQGPVSDAIDALPDTQPEHTQVDRRAQCGKASSMLQMMECVIRPDASLSRDLQQAALCVMFDTAFHHSPAVALHASRLMQRYLQLHPPCQLQHRQGEPPLLLENSSLWNPVLGLSIKERLNEDGSVDRIPEKAFTLLLHLATSALEAAQLPDAGPAADSKDGVVMDGAPDAPQVDAELLGHLLLLQWVVAQMQVDLATRLAAHASYDGGAGFRRNRLLTESLLSRVMEAEPGWFGGTRCKSQLVRTLIRTIVLTSPPCTSSPAPAPRFLPLPELGAQAAELLALILELYSALEAAGHYANYGPSRTSIYKNDRAELERCLVEALSGSTVLHELQAPAAKPRLLLALPPGEAARLVGSVLATATSRMYGLEAEGESALVRVHQYLHDGGKQQAGSCMVGVSEQLRFLADRKHLELAETGLGADDLMAYVGVLGQCGACTGRLTEQGSAEVKELWGVVFRALQPETRGDCGPVLLQALATANTQVQAM